MQIKPLLHRLINNTSKQPWPFFARLISLGCTLSKIISMKRNIFLGSIAFLFLVNAAKTRGASAIDVAPFGMSLPKENGICWEDPREIHRVVVHFDGAAPAPEKIHLEYWGSRWPEQHLPKDREPGGGDVGWMELGNWFNGGWRTADTEAKVEGNRVIFSFRPVDAKEFPGIKNYPAEFRYTLKIRIAPQGTPATVKKIEAFTDSVLTDFSVRLVFEKPPRGAPKIEAFNGIVDSIKAEKNSRRAFLIDARIAQNSDPNTFDRTLITVRGGNVFTFAADDLKSGALFLPEFGAAILPKDDLRDYAAVAARQKLHGGQTLYDRIAQLPEQTWRKAWDGVPPKKSFIYFPMGLDAGREKFRLDANGSFAWRCTDNLLTARPGKDTPRFALEPPYGRFEFDLPWRPAHREIEESCLPICHTTWERDGVRIQQIAFVTELGSAKDNGTVPPADAFAVCCVKFYLENMSGENRAFDFPVRFKFGEKVFPVLTDENGFVFNGHNFRGQILSAKKPANENGVLKFSFMLKPKELEQLSLKIPYVVLTIPPNRMPWRNWASSAKRWRSEIIGAGVSTKARG